MPWIVEEIACRTLEGFVWEVFGDGRGHVQVRADTWLTSLDQHLAERWQMPWDWARALIPLKGQLFLDGTRIQRLDVEGGVATVGSAPVLAGLDKPGRVLACLDDGFVVGGVGRIARVDRSGGSVWPSMRTCNAEPTSALVSGDRLLVLTDALEYYNWGYLGPALLLDLRDGSPVATLRGRSAAALGGGSFLLGLEGYEVFDTWLHGPDGALLQQWRSYGHYVVDAEESVRVVELDRVTPTRSRVVRLSRAGSIDRGPALRSCLASSPVTLADGTIVFLDGVALTAVSPALAATTLATLIPKDLRRTSRNDAWLALEGDVLFVVVSQSCRDEPVVDTAHCWSFRIAWS